MPFESLLVCSFTPGFMDWRWMVYSMVSRLVSNHSRVKSHLNRIKIVAEAVERIMRR
jgi:hypothetical protein